MINKVFRIFIFYRLKFNDLISFEINVISNWENNLIISRSCIVFYPFKFGLKGDFMERFFFNNVWGHFFRRADAARGERCFCQRRTVTAISRYYSACFTRPLRPYFASSIVCLALAVVTICWRMEVADCRDQRPHPTSMATVGARGQAEAVNPFDE